jgi:hypothetical protein
MKENRMKKILGKILKIMILATIIFVIEYFAYRDRGYLAFGGESFISLGVAFSPIWMELIEWVEG